MKIFFLMFFQGIIILFAQAPKDNNCVTYINTHHGDQFVISDSNSTSKPVGASLIKAGIILGLGAAGSFDEGMVESPAVWFDKKNQLFGMVYTGYNKSSSKGHIGLAWSKDLIHWEKDKRSPIFSPSGIEGTPDSASVTGPLIFFEGDTYYLFYIGCTNSGYEKGVKSLCMATSKDLITWKRNSVNPIIAPNDKEWMSLAVYHPSIVKKGSTYYMFFNACGKDEKEQIGYATTRSILGPWKVDDINSPVLKIGTKGSWEDGFIGDPSLYQFENKWYLSYYGYSATTGKAYDGLAWTTEDKFPLGWEKYALNPVLSPGPELYDITYAHKPFIINYNGKHYHYYTAVGSGGRRIALAYELYNIR